MGAQDIKNLHEKLDKLTEVLGELKEEMVGIKKDQESLFARFGEAYVHLEEARKNFVSKDRFKPIEMLVYGATGTILLAVLSAVIYLVIKQ